jgi:hypothetical protein
MENIKKVYVVGSGNMAHMHCLAINSTEIFDSCRKVLVIKDNIYFDPPKNFRIEKFSNIIDEKIKNIYFLIIAAGAPFQSDILKTFLAHTNIYTYLLEKNLTNSLKNLEIISKNENNGFVNFPLHFHNEFLYLEKFFNQVTKIEVFSNSFILLTNAMHYLNLAKRIFGSEPLNLEIFPESKLLDTKRSYAKDFYGEILVDFSSGRNLNIKSVPSPHENFTIKLTTAHNGIFLVDINQGTINNNDNNLINVTPFNFSTLGNRVYHSIFTRSSNYMSINYSLQSQSLLLSKIGNLYFGEEFNNYTKLPVA